MEGLCINLQFKVFHNYFLNKIAMDFIETVKKRRSIRKFKQSPVPMDLIKKTIKVATLAPTACNIQGWRFIVIDNQKVKDEIVDQGGAVTIKSAPAGILVAYDNRAKNTEYFDYIQSGAAAIENILLAATHLGIGSCWVCHLPAKNKLRKILNIPQSFSPIAYILLGYPEAEPKQVPRIHKFDDLIGYNKFNFSIPEENINPFKLSVYRFFRKVYLILPNFIKKGFINKFVDRNFVKKFDD